MFADVLVALDKTRAVAIIRGLAPDKTRKVAEALLRGGVKLVEVTLNSPEALDSIGIIAREFPEAIPGAGTVLSSDDVQRAAGCGAKFIAAPNTDLSVVEACKKAGCVSMPGAMTPSEVYGAVKAGADIVKVFPASVVGRSFFRELKGPFPYVKTIATGGIGPEDAGEFIKMGAYAVGLGSSLVRKEAVEAGDFSVIETLARKLLDSISSALQRY